MKAGVCETLREVADVMVGGAKSSSPLRNFLAFMTPDKVENAVREAPPLLGNKYPDGIYFDAYVAAVAELLSQRAGCPVPDWVEDPARFLEEFRYPSKNQKLNDLLMQEAPEAFRKRKIVVSANVLEIA